MTPVEFPVTGTNNKATTTENAQNAISEDGDNLDDSLKLARLQGRIEEKKKRKHGTEIRTPPSPAILMVFDSFYSELVQHQHPPYHAGYKKPRYHNGMR